MLLRRCLIYIKIIILRHILCLVYVRPCLGQGLFVLYLCDLFFIFNLISIVINHITPFKIDALVFHRFFRISRIIFNMGEKYE